MDFSEYLGQELIRDGVRYFVAYIGEDGITIKRLSDSKDSICLNAGDFPFSPFAGTFVERFDFYLNYIEAGVFPYSQDVENRFGYKDPMTEAWCKMGLGKSATCVTGATNG